MKALGQRCGKFVDLAASGAVGGLGVVLQGVLQGQGFLGREVGRTFEVIGGVEGNQAVFPGA